MGLEDTERIFLLGLEHTRVSPIFMAGVVYSWLVWYRQCEVMYR